MSASRLTVPDRCPLTGTASTAPPASTPRRADAKRNRARILDAAKAALATPGELRLNAVAEVAGVGQGTLYRHFPTRQALLAEVYQRDVEQLVATAHLLLAERPPLEALLAWLDRLADYAQIKRGVLAAVEQSVWHDLSARSHGPIGDALHVLLDAGKTAGVIRPDVDARDVILLVGYLTRLDDAEWDRRARPLLQIILDGLRATPKAACK